MKNSANILSKFALGLAIAGSLAACSQNAADNKAATTSTTTATPANNGIVYINEDSVSLKYQAAIDMRKRLEDKGNAVQKDVAARQQAVQRKYAEAQRAAATMTPEQQRAAGESIQRDGQAFQAYQQRAGAEFQNIQAEEQKKLFDKVTEFAKQYAKEKGYKMILSHQGGSTTVLYGDASLDITKEFIKGLNDAYGKDKK